MPYLTDSELEKSLSLRPTRGEDDRDAGGGPTIGSFAPMAAGGMGAAAVVGFVRAKFEDPSTGEWRVPGTSWDAEATALVASAAFALGGGYIGLDRQWRTIAAIGAIGIGGHYFGEVARRYGKTGKLDWHVGGGVPPWDPNSYDPTQFAAPYDDIAAEGLASSGV